MKYLKIFFVAVLLILGYYNINNFVYAAEKYILEVDTEVYDTAEDALRNNNVKLLYPAGEYYIHKESQGMFNISKSSTKWGAWVNPNTINTGNTVNEKESETEIYGIQKKINTYRSSSDAEKSVDATAAYNEGNYYIYKQENGMLNITKEVGKEGDWINPNEETSFTGYDNNKYYVENTIANGWHDDGNGEYFFYLGEKYTGYAKDSTGLKYFNNGRYSDKKTTKKNISRTKDKNLAINSFQYMNLKSQTKYTSEELNFAIDKFAGNNSKLLNKGHVFKEAEEKYKINALYLLAHAAIETSWGHSQIAHDKNNFFGISAFDKSPYESATTFENTDTGIIKGAEWISSNYIHTDKYPSAGAFLGNKTEGMNKNYATDVRWGRNIARLMKEINNYLGNKEK